MGAFHTKDREAKPLVMRKKDTVEIHCPFCKPSHPIHVGKTAQCGTVLILTAKQELWKGVNCALCGKGDGTLMRVGNLYRHTHDCTPGMNLFHSENKPRKSFGARIVFHLPRKAQEWIRDRYHRVAVELHDDPKDKKATGYIWDARPPI